MLAVAASARAYAASPEAEVTLSHGLPTPPLPAAPAAVGDPWQNRGLPLLVHYGDGIIPSPMENRWVGRKMRKRQEGNAIDKCQERAGTEYHRER
jgi:hypothetical protein